MDLEEAIEFLTQNQAELSAKIGMISDRLVTITDNLTVQGTLVARLETAVQANTELLFRQGQQIGSIQEAIVALVASDQRLLDKIEATDGRVNTLIDAVERLLNRRNGKSEPQ
ncbi:MAG TPA: hypothetical protein VL523_15090 [Terriglobia bacterium]|nr:hypothetical protein [Terriglobia bacterium]